MRESLKIAKSLANPDLGRIIFVAMSMLMPIMIFVIRIFIYAGGRLGGRNVTAFFEIVARNYFLRLPESMIFISTGTRREARSDFSR